jgi:diguanylate cyclase (GGDEF)-like protein/PAS domain S-box-containing protein
MLKNAMDGIHVMNIHGDVVEANDAFCNMLGYTNEEVLRLNISDWNAQWTRKELQERIKKLIGKSARFETKHRRKNGTLIDVEVSTTCIDIEDAIYFFASSRDITERKKSETKLLQHKIAIETANDGFWLTDDNGILLEVNQAYARMSGYTIEELQGKHISDFEAKENTLNEIKEHIAKIMSKGMDTFETRHIAKDGHKIDLEISTTVIPNSNHIVSFLRDISERKKLHEDIHRHKVIVETAREGFWRADNKGFLLEANQSYANLTGYSIAELCGMHISMLDAIDNPEDVQNRIKEIYEKGSISFETQHKHKDGHLIDIEVSTTILRGTDELVVFCRDISDRKRTEQSLQVTASVFSISQEGIFITDSNNNIVDVNLAFTKITGYIREEVIGKNPKLLSSGLQGKEFYTQLWETLNRDKAWRGEIWNRRKSGEIYPEMLSISALCDIDGNVMRHVAVFSDISHLKEHEAELIRVAHFDPLTSIPNRVLLADRMKQGISQTSRDKNMMAVCYLDLDGFKLINDTMGHEVGDSILIEVSKRIEHTIRGGDTVARLGGDEFIILLLGLEKEEDFLTTLDRLLKSIADPIMVQYKTLKISASIGVSIYPNDNEDPDTLMRHADQAMYVAKESGKNRYHIYDVEMDKRARNQNAFLQSIRDALDKNEFELHYQPKINLRTKELAGVEALIRWRHPERGVLLPSEFLRQIENTGLDMDVGEWVTKTALAQIEKWGKIGLDIDVSINISGFHLESPNFVSKLKMLLSSYPDLPFGRLQIEVLETVALNEITVVQEIIESCREIGVGFSLDDFGTGYSSLSYLSALPVDTIKIDQSFVRDMLEDNGDSAIVQGIIALAKAFERHTVAEGIETNEHFQALLNMGCEIGQGYCIARPMLANELIGWKFSYH